MSDPLFTAVVALIWACVWRWYHPDTTFWAWLKRKAEAFEQPPAPPPSTAKAAATRKAKSAK